MGGAFGHKGIVVLKYSSIKKKKSGSWGEMADSKSGAKNAQDKPGISFHSK